jgi:hypothetical protein
MTRIVAGNVGKINHLMRSTNAQIGSAECKDGARNVVRFVIESDFREKLHDGCKIAANGM